MAGIPYQPSFTQNLSSHLGSLSPVDSHPMFPGPLDQPFLKCPVAMGEKKGILFWLVELNVNPGIINCWLILIGGCPILVGIKTTFGGNTPLTWLWEMITSVIQQKGPPKD